MNSKTAVLIAIIVLGLIVIGYLLYANGSKPASANLDKFSQCLAEKKVTMYGAEWCAHCQAEKGRFGSAFKYVPYVECPQNVKVCTDLGIEGYPTWILPDGRKLVGEQGLEKLSAESGCQLPPEN